jgi:predicted kinase
MSNRLVLIRGLPGSGKSTISKTYFSDWIHLEADMYFMSPQGVYLFDGSRIKNAHSWCFETTKILLNSGSSVVVANTFTTGKEINPYITYAVTNNVPYVIFRTKNQYGSIHNVPEEAIDRMKARFEDLENEVIWR